MKKSLEHIFDTLKENSMRLTKSRQAVARILTSSKDNYLSAEEIHQEILISQIEENCDLVSVYRILNMFEKLNIVKKMEFNHEATRYILTSSKIDSRNHEHYFKCNKCYEIRPFSGCFVSKIEKKLKMNGYTNLTHHLEITGLCPGCSR